jgi:endoglucanase
MRDEKVWLGWTYWAAGAMWGAYPFSIQPGKGPEALQLTVLREFLPAP